VTNNASPPTKSHGTDSKTEANTLPATLATTPPRGFVLWLSVAQLISWGTLFYTFSLLLEHFERDLSLSRVDASIAFSIALLVEGMLAYFVGRLIDAGRARAAMCVGSLLAAIGFVAMSLVQTRWQLYAAWSVLGVAMSGTLYQPAFSLLIRRYPTDFRRAIITLTFLGGLASTVFIPLMAWLISAFTWRGAVIALAILHLAICLPIHAYWLRGEPRGIAHSGGSQFSSYCFLASPPALARTSSRSCVNATCPQHG
jgi:MFS family permease